MLLLALLRRFWLVRCLFWRHLLLLRYSVLLCNLHRFFLLSVLSDRVRRLVHYLHSLFDEMRDELLDQEMALLLLFSELLPVAVAPLTVPPARLAGRAVGVALPCTSQLVSLVSIVTFTFVTACRFLVYLSLLLLTSMAHL